MFSKDIKNGYFKKKQWGTDAVLNRSKLVVDKSEIRPMLFFSLHDS